MTKEERKEYIKKYYEANKEKIVAYMKEYQKKNKERKQEYDKKYREENLEKVRAVKKKYREENIEKVKTMQKKYREENLEKVRALRKKYKAEHKDHVNADTARRRAQKVKATPKWFDQERLQIEALYEKARELNLEVDHVVPIRSKKVCGLHTWANLQLLDKTLNSSKNNRHWPDMP